MELDRSESNARDDRREPWPDRRGGGGYPPAPPPRASGGCLPWFLLLVLIALGASVLLNLALIGGQLDLAGSVDGPRKHTMREEWVEGKGDARICLIEVEGMIAEETGPAGPFGPPTRALSELERRLDAVREDAKIKAIVLRIDSPGGSVTASDGMWRALTEFKREREIPIVVSMGGVCASGGYYIAAPADAILAEPTTITGSIGVIMSAMNVHGLLEKVGVQGVTIKSGSHKDLMNAYEPPREEDRKILQAVVDDAYDRFVQIVHEGRTKAGLDEAAVRVIADGRIYTASQALENKLIDEIGYLDDAIARAKALAGIEEARVFRYRREPSFMDILSGNAMAKARGPLGLDLSAPGLIEMTTPRLYYLYR